MRAWRRAAGVALAGCAALWLGGELAFWLASAAPAGPPPGVDCAVLVLGYPTRGDGTPDTVQRLRVAAGVAALQRYGCAKLIVSGGAAHNEFVEADAMARVAEELGVPADRIVRERAARTTWENVALSLPFLADSAVIYVASEGLHARRGVRYLCRQRPDLCARARPVASYTPLQRFWWKPAATVYELWSWLRDPVAPDTVQANTSTSR